MIEQKNPIILAFVGDAVQTLYVRERLASADAKIGGLHKMASAQLNAVSQSEYFTKIEPALNEIERDLATRALNTAHNTIPKSCTIAEYHRATALEAVIGYNYLMGNTMRAKELSLYTKGEQ